MAIVVAGMGAEGKLGGEAWRGSSLSLGRSSCLALPEAAAWEGPVGDASPALVVILQVLSHVRVSYVMYRYLSILPIFS